MNAQFEHTRPGEAMVSGRLDFATVLPLEQQGVEFLRKAEGACQIDLSGVSYSGSVGVALLLAWCREAQRLERTLSFTHLPENMQKLLLMSGLSELIPVAV